MTYSETTFQKAFKNRYKKIPKRRNSNIKLLHNIYLKKKWYHEINWNKCLSGEMDIVDERARVREKGKLNEM